MPVERRSPATPTDGHSGIPSGGLAEAAAAVIGRIDPFRRAEGRTRLRQVELAARLQGQHDPTIARRSRTPRSAPTPRISPRSRGSRGGRGSTAWQGAEARTSDFRCFGPRKRSVAPAVSRTGSADPRTTPWTQSLAPTAIRLDSAPGTRVRGNDSIGQHTGAPRADDHDCRGHGIERFTGPLRWHSPQDLRSRGTNASRRCAPPPTTSTRSLGVGRAWWADGRAPSALAENSEAGNS
jgi:hypothetical protein